MAKRLSVSEQRHSEMWISYWNVRLIWIRSQMHTPSHYSRQSIANNRTHKLYAVKHLKQIGPFVACKVTLVQTNTYRLIIIINHMGGNNKTDFITTFLNEHILSDRLTKVRFFESEMKEKERRKKKTKQSTTSTKSRKKGGAWTSAVQNEDQKQTTAKILLSYQK